MNTKPVFKNPTLVAFCYSWGDSKKIDVYQSNLVNAFIKKGFDVHVILSSDLAQNITHGIRPEVSQEKIISYVKNVNADLVLSMNHGGLSRKIQKGIDCPIITWIVDDLPHIFYPEDSGKLGEMFDEKIKIIISSVELRNEFIRQAPGLQSQLILLPAATDVAAFTQVRKNKQHNISFVASSLDFQDIHSFITENLDNTKTINSIITTIKCLRQNYRVDFHALILELGLDNLLELKKWDVENFKMILANLISNNERYQVVEALNDLGISLFGNKEWINSLATSTKILESYQTGRVVNRHSQLVDIYQASKISINVPQIQVGSALSYRVFDIMASDSLLITKYHPDSDAFYFFGKDCPVPMYKDTAELKQLCKYYLENEDERLEIVKKCNTILSRGFSFDDRIEDMIKIASLTIPGSTRPGNYLQLPTNYFNKIFSRVNLHRRLFKMFLLRVSETIINKKNRKRIIKFFSNNFNNQ